MPPQEQDRPKSPFFAPSTPMVIVTTPEGTKKSKKKAVENRSTILGASANLVNDIVGAGIAGIPYAVGRCGFVSGCFLILLCAVLTDKSLRLLVETAKYSNTPSYETLAEAAFGRKGFLFIAANMFVFSYGSMVGYLMMVKETLPYVFGVINENPRRLFLFLISISVMVPVSSQRDMADLSKTSRMNVMFCTIIVGLVVYLSPTVENIEENGGFLKVVGSSVFNGTTIFAGLGVFSYTYLVQHSAFIIAGSLRNPTRKRWASVTFRSMCVCATECMVCGVFGYLAFLGDTQGNILDNFNPRSVPGNVARALLGLTMLFIYPIEAFVSRHVCVVIFFTGQSAHDGDDTAVLDRADRRIALTVAIYVLAVIPAIIFTNLGPVLSLTGTIGGSCLSYMGPGIVYIGIHGKKFIAMADKFFVIRKGEESNDTEPLVDIEGRPREETQQTKDSCFVWGLKNVAWYVMLMPVWYRIAVIGSKGYEAHKEEVSLEARRITRIDSMRDVPVPDSPPGKSVAPRRSQSSEEMMRSGSYGTLTAPKVSASSYQKQTIGSKVFAKPIKQNSLEAGKPRLASAKKGDSQDDPTLRDFVIAVAFIIFGVVALFAGLFSLYVELS